MSRRAHLVGAWPGRNPEHAMETALDHLAPFLDRMSDGETGDRSLWVTSGIDTFRANPDVEMLHDGTWTSYEDTARWAVREGGTLDPANIRLHYRNAFERSYPAFQVLRERYDRPDLRFQVGIPAPMDLAVYTFGPAAFGDPSIGAACAEATLREVAEIAARADDDVVFQIETVLALVAAAREPEPAAQAEVARQFAGGLTDFVARAPEGTHWGIHLCLGDFHHRAYGNMTDTGALVALANALAAGWPVGRTLDYIHVPFAAASEPPVVDEAFYAPLRQLRLPDDVRLVAGFLHEKLDHEAHKALMARIEEHVGRRVDIAAACGLGRRDDPNEAFLAMRETTALIETA
jgi:hypothetical protein